MTVGVGSFVSTALARGIPPGGFCHSRLRASLCEQHRPRSEPTRSPGVAHTPSVRAGGFRRKAVDVSTREDGSTSRDYRHEGLPYQSDESAPDWFAWEGVLLLEVPARLITTHGRIKAIDPAEHGSLVASIITKELRSPEYTNDDVRYGLVSYIGNRVEEWGDSAPGRVPPVE